MAGTKAPVGQVQDRQPGSEEEMHPQPDYMPRFAGSDRLKDKVVIITGGDSGIGRATAILFAREGAKLAIHYKDESEDAEITLKHMEEEGGEAFIFAGDIGDPKTSEALVGKTIERFGKLDVVVNNAAEQHAQDDIADISEEQLTRTFKTNIFGAFHLLKAARPHLKSGASIILVTSVTAYRGQPLLIDYSSTKGALLSLIRALSGNLASENIRVNGVAPGPIWTPLIPASFPEEKVETFGKDTPLGRPGQPNEVAPSLLFLACEDSSYISGQVLHPNGGELVGG